MILRHQFLFNVFRAERSPSNYGQLTMRMTSLRIENFRSIKSLDVELGETTVFIGPNNAGKTAILDAIRIALTRRWGQRGTGFTEYDIHLATETEGISNRKCYGKSDNLP
jgi:AAA15 family ATPase/GTPase